MEALNKYILENSERYAERVKELEADGITTSDAQAIVDLEFLKELRKAP